MNYKCLGWILTIRKPIDKSSTTGAGLLIETLCNCMNFFGFLEDFFCIFETFFGTFEICLGFFIQFIMYIEHHISYRVWRQIFWKLWDQATFAGFWPFNVFFTDSLISFYPLDAFIQSVSISLNGRFLMQEKESFHNLGVRIKFQE